MTAPDLLEPLRALADPSVGVPFEMDGSVDQVCGLLGTMKFAAFVFDDGKLAAVLGKRDGTKLTDGNIKAFCRHWRMRQADCVMSHNHRAAILKVLPTPEEDEMITPKIDDRGLTAAVCTCDICGREAHERAKFQYSRRGSEDRKMDEGQVRLRLQGRGWSYVKNVLRCPSCETARKSADKPPVKEKDMAEKPKTLTLVSTPAPAPVPVQTEPTREQKRQINDLLEEVYDTKAERYVGRESDATVAEALGAEFKIDWVAQVREEFYGPANDNSEMIEIMAEIAEIKMQLVEAMERSAEVYKTLGERLDSATARLDGAFQK